MKVAFKIILVVVYVLFVGVTFAFYTPPTLLDAGATFVIPAVACWGIYWMHVKTGEGLIGLLRKKPASSDDAQ